VCLCVRVSVACMWARAVCVYVCVGLYLYKPMLQDGGGKGTQWWIGPTYQHRKLSKTEVRL